MAFSSASSSSLSAEINVTPLIDVLLVLLIIFMVIVPVLPRGLGSSIPQNAPSANAAASSRAVVQILAGLDGWPPHYLVNQRETTFTDLRPMLQRIFSAKQDRTLFIQGDRDLSYDDVAAVIGEARAAGAGAVAFMDPQRHEP